MNILIIGDIYSKSGRDVLKKHLNNIVAKNNIDFVVANAENISHGKGINKNHYNFLKQLKVDVITSGNHIFKVKETQEFIIETNDLLRPLNMYESLPGKGTVLFEKNGFKIRITNLLGTTFMDHANSPFEVLDKLLENDNSDIHIVDFHAEASAEKIAFAWNYDGKISALVGTHTHVQTADERILPKGTAFITDIGMTGPINSIIGANPDEVIYKEKTGLPTKFIPSENAGKLQAVIIRFENKKAKSIERIQVI
ncbi:TIGR00282 family metallophosphoesterase [Spiroplasma tabanidicola]|uniref:TIGR00282 family metallophosphoesterase n=1 Tax=Spiroplasma tabanidicola TaxID=324079 RepID=A0A6I6CD29_9MOLU|nr:TIGR00282 family metallophosphoesterase [Spiroplasma tabanidicola]QGS52208.1 TIGR00282 family metallophosphoesterase [Spiroplasma tabanidicola]